ncbi:exopolysaccharide transport family protein [Thermophagus xiamenensis]|uniref:non-specific protein-tyrosine kinase n=1 Tax=Thermophagus xiamenensis TaxID=385682 RepID=A0A1I1VAT6_9BACT|nr:polysaccharide biosynthesis tyrosine autokinase [Thermophagus xiamenensis]SFD80087.1 capsular exopolysaccharide family [Thermophagus xiamenensis]
MIQKNHVSDDVRNVTRRLLKYWKLYPVFLVLFVGLSFVYIKTQPRIHEMSAKLVVHVRERGVQDPTAFIPGSELFAGRNNFENSLLTIQASPIIREAVTKFNSRIEYYKSTFFNDVELYNASPFNVVMDGSFPQLVGVSYNLEVLSPERFRLTIQKGSGGVYDFINQVFTRRVEGLDFSVLGEFGKPLESDFFKFTIFWEDESVPEEDNLFKFRILTDDQLVAAYKSRLTLEPANLNGTVINVRYRTGNSKKGMDFLEAFLETVIENNLERKNHIANSTIEYIDQLLESVSDSLKRAEQTLQRYQSARDVMDVSQSAERLYNELSRVRDQKQEFESRVDYLRYLSEQISKDDNYTEYSMSAVMALNNNSLSILMEEYISLVGQRTRLIENNQTKSPLLSQVEARISNLRKTIRENVRYSLNIAEQDLRKTETRLAQIDEQIRQLPETQRNLQTFSRDFRLNDETYTYLMQKKAEAQIARASNLPDYEVFDPPSYAQLVSPKSNKITGFAVFLALLSATVLALAYDNIFGKVKDEKDFLDLDDDVRFLGEILHTRSIKKLMGENQFSSQAESIRTLRSNLLAFCKDGIPQTKSSELILITSSVQGEGKTFTSYFLARFLARLNRPTLLIELDLRRPRLISAYAPELNHKPGLVDYVHGEADLKSIIYPSAEENFYLIPSDKIPPNPSEILESEKFREMLEEVKSHFDFVILDSAPLIVADTRSTIPLADVVLMVTRAGYTPLNVMKKTLQNMKEFKARKVGLVLNDVSMGLNRRYYNYKYGYRK